MNPILRSTALRSALPRLQSTKAAIAGARYASSSNYKISSRSNPNEIPLTDPLPGLAEPDTSVYSSLSLPDVKLTTLPSGLRVVSQETYGHVSTLSLYVDAGSRYETPDNNGVSHLLEHLAFKSTAGRTAYRTVREVEYLGGAIMASASREQIVFSTEFLRSRLPYFVSLLADTAQNRFFKGVEVKQQLEAVAQVIKEVEGNAQTVILEGLHGEAYGYKTLGTPLVCPSRNVGVLSADTVASFLDQYFLPSRFVLAGAGVDHDDLVGLAAELFPVDRVSAAPPAEASKYSGGEWRVQALDSPATHVAIGFEGVSYHDKDLAAVCVLHTLLGGGSSFSAGGPGKGMYSRLFQNVLNRYHWVQSATAFNMFYSDSGLFGIHATTDGANASKVTDIVVGALQQSAGPVNAGELARAKAQTTSSFLINLESRSIVADDIGRQVLIYGKRIPPAELVDLIAGVTAADIERVAKRILSSKPTVAVYGDQSSVATYDAIAAKLSS